MSSFDTWIHIEDISIETTEPEVVKSIMQEINKEEESTFKPGQKIRIYASFDAIYHYFQGVLKDEARVDIISYKLADSLWNRFVRVLEEDNSLITVEYIKKHTKEKETVQIPKYFVRAI